MSKSTFIDNFILHFLACHASTNYWENVNRGEHFAAVSAEMVEEAEILAKEAWTNVLLNRTRS